MPVCRAGFDPEGRVGNTAGLRARRGQICVRKSSLGGVESRLLDGPTVNCDAL